MNSMQENKVSKQTAMTECLSSQLLTFLHHEVQNQTILIWNYKKLRYLPSSLIQEASHVKQIYLKHNLLKELPDNLHCLQNLTFLYLYGNNLEELCDSIGDIKTLQILDVSNNKLKALPLSLTRLSNLRSLVAANNKISSIPAELSKIKTLSLLILSGNELKKLPCSFGILKALQGIYFDNNFLSLLPHTIVQLPLLVHLSCCNNDLISLPLKPFMCQPTVFFDNNPQLNYIPFSILPNLKIGDFYDPFIVPSCGCFVQDHVIKHSVVSIDFQKRSSDSSTLSIPTQLHKISWFYVKEQRRSIPPLSELCIRFIWKLGILFLKNMVTPAALPAYLIDIFNEGPIAFCELCQSITIFTYASIIIITISISSQTGIPGKEVPSIMFFCSDFCAQKYVNNCSALSDDYGKWLYHALSQHLKIKLSRSDSRRENSLNTWSDC